MKQPRTQAALIVAGSLIASTVAWTCPIEPETAAKAATFSDALVAIEIAFPLHPSSRDASAALPTEPAAPLTIDGAASPSVVAHPATFFDFDFAARR
jgi:hypothetical protein